ncbi:MAG TPA: arginine deiminase family protein [Thermoplasmata archaeon]|nr:arginine deiminase family protein [Thermoplasmata archaeon]
MSARTRRAAGPARTSGARPGGRAPTDLGGRTRARAEWDPLREVLIHRPGVEMFFGLMEPYSFLYERAFRIDEATYEHGTLEHALVEEGITVRHLIHLAIEVGARHPELLEQVRHQVLRLVRYSGPKEMVERARRALRQNLDRFDGETLFNILLLRPSVHLERHPGTRVILPQVRLDTPLANLYFMRDQQALTANGFVLGRMAKPQRRNEPLLTGALLRTWGADIVTEIRAPGTFEGGDFIPMGSFALLGTGDRTNASAVRQILAAPIGFDEVAVVHQPSHPAVPGDAPDPMIDMHLDTYLNVPGKGLAVGCGALLRRAQTEVYVRRGARGMVRSPGHRSLYDYLTSKKVTVVEISTLEQMSYASNFLCVRDRRIIAVEVDQEVDRVIATLSAAARADPHRYRALLALVKKERTDLLAKNEMFPRKVALREAGVEVVPVSLQEITGGYGGAHCMTCAMVRSS